MAAVCYVGLTSVRLRLCADILVHSGACNDIVCKMIFISQGGRVLVTRAWPHSMIGRA